MMHIFVTLNNTSVAVCERHVHMGLADGWSFLEQREREIGWPCYFIDVESFWHEVNGQRYLSRSLHSSLLTEATTMAAYREIVKRTYGNLRGVTFGTEEEGPA